MARKKYSPEETLRALYNLQYIDSRIDRMRELEENYLWKLRTLKMKWKG